MFARMMSHRPYTTSALTSVTFAMTGDTLCQMITKKENETFDFKRTLRYGLCGLTMGPQVFYWYKILNRISNSGIKRMIIDQSTFTHYDLMYFFTLTSILNGYTQEEWKNKIKNDYLKTYTTNLCYWPIVLAINFTYVSLPYRLIFSGTCSMFYNIYLSYKVHK